MRSSLCIAAGLLVLNVALLEREQPRPVVPRVEPRVIETIRIEVPVPDDTQGEAKRLGWLWQAKHNGLRMPACTQVDPLATLDADVDPTPGREHVIGNRQFGVAMYAQSGLLIAHMDPIGCVEPRGGDQSLSLSYDGRLIVRTRQLEHDGEHLDAHVVERRGDELDTLLTLDVGGKRSDAAREWQVEGRLYMGADEIEVKYHGRQRSPGRDWEEVDDHCTWRIATRSSSCRTRAGARTRGSE